MAAAAEQQSGAGAGKENADFVKPTPTPKSGPQSLKALAGLKPLVSASEPAPVAREPARPPAPRAGDLSSALAESIDLSLEEEMRDAARDLAPEPAPPEENEALDELRDESSQKTVEVPNAVVAKMMDADPSDEVPTSTRGQSLPAGAGGVGEGPRAPVESGLVGAPDIAALLGRIYVEGLSGLLTFRRGEHGETEKSIAFENGAPSLASSNLREDRMGESLVREGRLSSEQRAGQRRDDGDQRPAPGRGAGRAGAHQDQRAGAAGPPALRGDHLFALRLAASATAAGRRVDAGPRAPRKGRGGAYHPAGAGA